jgi:predicted ATPase
LAEGKALPLEVVEHIVSKTDGVPLYVEELTKMLLESDVLSDGETAYELRGTLREASIPATLQDSLMARLDQLHEAKEVAQLGSVLGREFSYEMLQAITSQTEETVQSSLAQLVDAELLYQRGRPPRATYIFKHALIQDTAYASLLRSTRQQVHQQVADVLATEFPENVGGQSVVVAHHYMEAGLYEQALAYWKQSGQEALERSAYQEAVACFEQALAALDYLPKSREAQEQAIDLRLDLRSGLLPLGEYERIFDCMREAQTIAERLEDHRRLGQIYSYLAQYFNSMGEYDRAITSSRHALTIAANLEDLSLQIGAQQHLGVAYYGLGDYRQAIKNLHRNVTSLSEELRYEHFGRHFLPAVVSCSFLSLSLCSLGEFAEGIRHGQEGMRIAEAVDNPSSIIFASCGIGGAYLTRGELQSAIATLKRAHDLCHIANVQVFLAPVVSALGYAYAVSGRVAEALSLLEQAVEESSLRQTNLDSVFANLSVIWLGRALSAGQPHRRALHTRDSYLKTCLYPWGTGTRGVDALLTRRDCRAERFPSIRGG